MNTKKSFVLYHDMRAPLELLTDEQRGKLFMALFDYSEHGVEPAFDDGALTMAFAFTKKALDRDGEKWEETRRKRAEAGRKGAAVTNGKARQNCVTVVIGCSPETEEYEENDAQGD